ncbi:MAG: ATP-dependent metallopeptidase FtsH/Yme1/Tma family protein, partial [Candidatus Dormibacteraceae bacterium]
MSRFPRSSLFYFALVVVLGLVFYFTWQSLQNGGTSTDWHFSYLITQASQNNVKSLEINGTDGIATDSGGHKHNVVLQDTTANPQWLTDMINT